MDIEGMWVLPSVACRWRIVCSHMTHKLLFSRTFAAALF